MPVQETSPSRGAIRFSSFEVDVRAGELRKHGHRIRLQDQPFRVLQILLEHPGEVVAREELQRQIWPSDTFVDFDRGLNNAVKRLREALADSAEQPRYIETIPKRGYRFIAPVTANGNGVNEERAAAPPTEVAKHAEKQVFGSRGLHKAIYAITAATVLLLLLLLSLRLEGFRDRVLGKPVAASIRSIAVLPLQNLSVDPNQEYLADGMTEELITDLAQIGSLKVISRTSTKRYRNTSKSLPEIARELNVEGIVEGSVQQSGGRVRITTQLVHGPSDSHIWARSYERDLQNVLALEQDVAHAIVEEIRATITPREKARLSRNRSVSLRSLQAYLQGRYHYEQADSLSFRKDSQPARDKELATAREFFEQAIHDDPEYAQAYVGLASTWEDNEKQKAELRKALELDPDLAEAHEALATLDVLGLWNWPEAEAEYKRAIELNPNFSEAHARFAEYLDSFLRFDEGMNEFLRAQELDPGHSFNPNPFYRRRQYERAIEMDRNDISRHAFGFWAHANLAYDYEAAGMHDEAALQWEEVMRMLGYTEIAQGMHRALLQSGYKGAYRALTDSLEAADKRGSPIPAFFPATFYGMLGEKNRAFAWLERGYREHDASFAGLNVDPCWDPLRSDPRFTDLVHRVGLAQ